MDEFLFLRYGLRYSLFCLLDGFGQLDGQGQRNIVMDELSAKVSNCKLPWCISASERAKGNPSPVPGLSVAPSFTRKKGSNIFSFNLQDRSAIVDKVYRECLIIGRKLQAYDDAAGCIFDCVRKQVAEYLCDRFFIHEHVPIPAKTSRGSATGCVPLPIL